MRTKHSTTREITYFKFRHEGFDCMKEFSSGWMRNPLQVKPPLEGRERLVKFLRFDHGPRYDVQLPSVEARYKVGVLLLFDDPLELLRKSMQHALVGRPHVD